jgi:tetratricopeptide (TPR) repeat protein
MDLVTGNATVTRLKEDGIHYMQLGFNDLAIDSFRGAIELEDKTQVLPTQRDGDVPLNLGLIYFNQGRFNEARDAFRRAVEANPGNFKARYHLGRTEMVLGNHAAAREQFQMLEPAAAANPETQKHIKTLLAALDPVKPAEPAKQPIGKEKAEQDPVTPTATKSGPTPPGNPPQPLVPSSKETAVAPAGQGSPPTASNPAAQSAAPKPASKLEMLTTKD